jgi:hypothetical protein
MSKNKVSKESKNLIIARDKGVTSTDLLDKKLAVAWNIRLLSVMFISLMTIFFLILYLGISLSR